MLIEHDIQVSLLWFIEVLVCAVALLGAFVPQYRAACIIIFTMVALDLYLWPFFDSLPSGSGRYFACLAISSIFILLNIIFVRKMGLSRNLKLLIVLSIFHAWEAIDVAVNSEKSFIDYNYALLLAIVYLIYIISFRGALSYGREYFGVRLGRFNSVINTSWISNKIHNQGRQHSQKKG